jgi:hypothetical protein
MKQPRSSILRPDRRMMSSPDISRAGLGRLAWRWLLAILVIGCSDATGTGPRTAARMDVVGGQSQTGQVGNELADPLAVLVLDKQGVPIEGQVVTFRVVNGGGSVFAGAAVTNADGVAKEHWTLGGSVADSQVVEARAVDTSNGATLVFAQFIAVAKAGPAASVTTTHGDHQSEAIGTVLADSLVVLVRDAYGNPVPNAPITWTASMGGGTIAAASASTAASGSASAAWTLGPVVGEQRAQVDVAGIDRATFTATAVAEMTFLTKADGDEQLAKPLTAVPIPPTVLVTDANHQPRSGVTVRFVVTRGGGILTGGDAVSDASGIARVGSWTLGTQASNSVSATSPSGSLVTFSATAYNDPSEAVLSIRDGDGQSAPPGTVVAVAPAIRVQNVLGHDIIGAQVTFAVSSGGGTITGATTTTNSNGVATVGSWTLGGVVGVNTLTATTANATAVTFTATARQQSPDITVTIVAPTSTIIGDTVVVGAKVTSSAQLASVTAQIGNRGTALTGSQSGILSGTIDITEAPRDTAVVVVHATDINGHVTEAVRTYIHDRRPRLSVTAPINGSVARPGFTVDATCQDDDPTDCTLTVKRDGAVLAGPTASPMHATLDLSALDGTDVPLTIEARDSRNQTDFTTRTVSVELSNRLQLLASSNGTARDFRSKRLMSEVMTTTGDTLVVVHHLAESTADTVRYHGILSRAFLTTSGAAFTASVGQVFIKQLYTLRNGLPMLTANSVTSLAAAGDFIVYTVPPGMAGSLYRMNLSTGEQLKIADFAADTVNDVAQNGDVVFSSSGAVMRYTGSGPASPISTGSTSSQNVYPRTDGTNTVFLGLPGNLKSQTWLYDGSGVSLLADYSIPRSIYPDGNYALEGGWVAFTKADAFGNDQVWTRSPSGMLRAVTAFGSSSKIAALGSDGRVVVDNGSNRYLATPTGDPSRISRAWGSVVWRDDQFVMLLRNSALAVLP